MSAAVPRRAAVIRHSKARRGSGRLGGREGNDCVVVKDCYQLFAHLNMASHIV